MNICCTKILTFRSVPQPLYKDNVILFTLFPTVDENIPTLKCEFCGKVDYAHKFRRSKRFCSMACAKRYNVGCSRRLGLFKPQNANKQKKKKKEVPTKKAWKRTDAERLARPALPMQRVRLPNMLS